MPADGKPLGLRARIFAGRAMRRAARPALEGPGSPVSELADRVDGMEQSLAELWRLSELQREAIEALRVSVEKALPDLTDDLDRRFAVADQARAEEIQSLELLRRRIQALEESADHASG